MSIRVTAIGHPPTGLSHVGRPPTPRQRRFWGICMVKKGSDAPRLKHNFSICCAAAGGQNKARGTGGSFLFIFSGVSVGRSPTHRSGTRIDLSNLAGPENLRVLRHTSAHSAELCQGVGLTITLVGRLRFCTHVEYFVGRRQNFQPVYRPTLCGRFLFIAAVSSCPGLLAVAEIKKMFHMLASCMMYAY